MYDLTGGGDEGIDPINLVRHSVYDEWKDLVLRVMAETVSIRSDEPVLHSILSMDGRLLPHQLGACVKVLDGATGGAILADEVGLGKTIEAGLVISELECRGRARRVLVLTPASLVSQWRDELRQVFGLGFRVADLETRREARRNGHTIWDMGYVISSINTAKQASNAARIQAMEWDVVVVDEAHRLKDRSTQNFRLVQGLRAKVMLLLTATPVQNRLWELYNQVSLIDPRLLGTRDSFRANFFGDKKGIKVREPEALRKRLATVMIRNRRRDSPYLDLVKRFGQTVSFPLSPEEARLYDEVTDYIREEYLDALANRQNARGYLMVLYQRMLTSSSRAIASSLRRRMERVEDQLTAPIGPDGKGVSREVRRRLEEDLSRALDLEYSDGGTALFNIDMDPARMEMLHAELKALRRLCRLADAVGSDTKAEQLRSLIGTLAGEKVLVFTEFRATQAHLAELLRGDGHSVATFHGGMTPEEKDEAVDSFRRDRDVMISTESGGEGRNLQFCHILVNYDLPWNPMRVEQRIGRLHRIGQTHNVKIINFSTQDTIEEHVLDLLTRKIRLFEEVVGDLDIILGEVSDDDNFEAMIMRILAEAGGGDGLGDRFKEVGDMIDEVRRKAEEGGREGAGSIIATSELSTHLDPAEALDRTMEEQAVVKGLVEAYLRANGAKVWHDGLWCLEGTAPRSIMVAIGLDSDFRITFDRPVNGNGDGDGDGGGDGGGEPASELEVKCDGAGRRVIRAVTHGHPFLDSIIDECRRRGYTAMRQVPAASVGSKGVATFHVHLTIGGYRDVHRVETVHIDMDTLEAVEDPFDGDGLTVQQSQPQPPEGEAPRPPRDDLLPSRVEAAYSTARKVVEGRARALSEALAGQNGRRCDLMLERLNTYYDDLEEEMASKEKALEDERYELVRKIRASKERKTAAKYRTSLNKVAKRLEAMKRNHSSQRDRLRGERLEEIKRVEARRAMRPTLALIAVGVSLPSPGDGTS